VASFDVQTFCPNFICPLYFYLVNLTRLTKTQEKKFETF
jgi:hypothetical protein